MTDAELVEELIGFLWDATKAPGMPLWWCLRDDLKDAFRARTTRNVTGRLAGQRSAAATLEQELRA